MKIPVVRDVLEVNSKLAAILKKQFSENNVLVLNIISSPGSGKTSLLENTLKDLASEFRMAVIEGDIQTDNDAQRVASTGIDVVQINTDGGCHLDSNMIMEALPSLDLSKTDILFIENVGNLVCPAEFDCGEDYIVAILGATEGDDKPEKYPLLFHKASIMLINKIDLLPYIDFNADIAEKHARRTNNKLPILHVSCKSSEGLTKWYDWLRTVKKNKDKSNTEH